MNKRNTMLKVFGVATLTAILVGTAAILGNGTYRVAAFTPRPRPISVPCPSCIPTFGYWGFTHSQTARLTVVDMSDVPPGPCRTVEMTFYDRVGNIRQRSIQCLIPGRAASLDLNGSALEFTGLRAEMRARVEIITPPPDPDDNSINLVATVQVFDNDTGKTSFIVFPSGN